MRTLPILLFLTTISFFITSCNGLPLFKNIISSTSSPEPPVIRISPGNSDKPIEKSALYNIYGIVEYLRNYKSELLAIASLLFIWVLYRREQGQRKKIKLDEDDIAVLGLAADCLNDVMSRVRAKTKKRIIPFPRGD